MNVVRTGSRWITNHKVLKRKNQTQGSCYGKILQKDQSGANKHMYQKKRVASSSSSRCATFSCGWQETCSPAPLCKRLIDFNTMGRSSERWPAPGTPAAPLPGLASLNTPTNRLCPRLYSSLLGDNTVAQNPVFQLQRSLILRVHSQLAFLRQVKKQ